MKKNRLSSYSIILFISALMLGCSTSNIIDELASSTTQDPQDSNFNQDIQIVKEEALL